MAQTAASVGSDHDTHPALGQFTARLKTSTRSAPFIRNNSLPKACSVRNKKLILLSSASTQRRRGRGSYITNAALRRDFVKPGQRVETSTRLALRFPRMLWAL